VLFRSRTFWPNFYIGMFGSERVGYQTLSFLKSNYAWMKKMAHEKSSTDDYWYSVQVTILQLEGLFEGYVAGCGSSKVVIDEDTNVLATLDHPTLEHFLLINAWGDLYQIAMKFKEPGQSARMRGGGKMSTTSTTVEQTLVERCSAIIKVLPDMSDVTFGHATWDSYESLFPRIIKHYNFPLMRGGFAEHHYDVYFSSSPALLSSVDDFYTVSGYAQLGVMETTNSLFNIKLLDKVAHESNLCWMRVILSNQLATSGASWAEVFAKYHSGTYTNQWMAMDLKLFSEGSAPLPGFLTVLEEVPGLVHYEDQTEFLNKFSYWPSYNNPFYEDIFEASGYAKACLLDKSSCHDTAPRASIFRDYQSSIVDIKGTEDILSHNDWQTDLASLNDSCNSIACRGDLEPVTRKIGAFGALDAKVSSANLAKRYPGTAPVFFARLGPTHDQQPVFCWSSFVNAADYSHNGHPDCFDFDWKSFPAPTAANA